MIVIARKSYGKMIYFLFLFALILVIGYLSAHGYTGSGAVFVLAVFIIAELYIVIYEFILLFLPKILMTVNGPELIIHKRSHEIPVDLHSITNVTVHRYKDSHIKFTFGKLKLVTTAGTFVLNNVSRVEEVQAALLALISNN